MVHFPVKELKEWFKANKRSLPWREDPTPYAVWISEVMLQQTQVVTVIPYFLNWMNLFPTIKALSEAKIEEVIKAWEGLGYYSRARNLHESAKIIMEKFGGELPSSKEGLLELKGIGPYTLGAILSFAFRKKAAAIDGNVARVLTRFFEIEDDVSRAATQKKLQETALKILPDDESYVVNEALIELGATFCQKKPNCLFCPVQKGCGARRQGSPEKFPVKAMRIKMIKKLRQPVLLLYQENLLVRKCPKGEIMADLHEFPYFEGENPPEKLTEMIEERLFLKVRWKEAMPKQKQFFTNNCVTLLPHVFEVQNPIGKLPNEYFLFPKNKLLDLAFSSGHRRLAVAFIKL